MADTMQALVWTGPKQIGIEARPVPLPAPGEVLLEVGAVGICGSELSGYLGHNKLRVPPLVMGHEAAGTIAACDSAPLADGKPSKVGQRVTFNPLVTCGTCVLCAMGRTNLCPKRQLIGAHRPGAFARFVAVPANLCWALPDKLSLPAGALVETLACAVRTVDLTELTAGGSLLIIGAGPIGLACLVVAKKLGIDPILISDRAEGRLQVATRWGASEAVSGDVVARAKARTPFGVDAVIDAVGLTVTRQQAIAAVRPGGRVVWIGLHEEESPVAANWMIRQEISVVGSFAYTQPDFRRALDLMSAGVFAPAADWLDERSMSDGPAAFADLVGGACPAVKIVLKPT